MTGFPITGFSAVNGLGTGLSAVRASLDSATGGLIECPPRFQVETWVGMVDEAALMPLPDSLRAYESRQARMCQLGVRELLPEVSACVERYGPARVGLIVGTSTAGVLESENARRHVREERRPPESYRYERQHALHATTDVLRRITGIEGPSYVVSTACSSSGKVFADARRLLLAKVCDAVLVGGVDTLAQITLRGFNSLEVLSKDPCRPFSRERKGINIGEGAAFVLVESEDGREFGTGVDLLGVGESSDAHHMTAPHPDGLGARLAMEHALRQAGLRPADIDQVNVHGTATAMNDASEGKAICELFGSTVSVVATKGYTGHMLGAAGATEAVFVIDSLMRRRVPAGLGCDPLDPAIGVAVVQQGGPFEGKRALSNSFAFGGSNVSVLFGLSEAEASS